MSRGNANQNEWIHQQMQEGFPSDPQDIPQVLAIVMLLSAFLMQYPQTLVNSVSP